MDETISLKIIVEKIEVQNPLHAKKLKENIRTLDSNYQHWAKSFLQKTEKFLKKTNVSLDDCITFYLKKVNDSIFEMVNFFQTGKYRYNSFDEVNKRVYSDPDVMRYNMLSLLLSQVLWKQHYIIFDFFKKHISEYVESKSYLEIGGGHGLFINEAAKLFNTSCNFELLDISETSIEIAKSFIDKKNITYYHMDIFEFSSKRLFDFISMGEVLEHVEKPKDLLKKVKSLLKPEGVFFITVPTNAPDIDHIYLFNNSEEIRTLLKESGFKIDYEIEVSTEKISVDDAHKRKICVIYAAFLSF
ncbi:MAG: class I SAM-dependent methyltransferase [Salinivirgaceae bacterium]|nr:class I SAM-dependent methyltransferase [Salinivirgaceae bacterium]